MSISRLNGVVSGVEFVSGSRTDRQVGGGGITVGLATWFGIFHTVWAYPPAHGPVPLNWWVSFANCEPLGLLTCKIWDPFPEKKGD